MNSPKRQTQEFFDLRLRRGLKQWLNPQSPPADIKARILQTAAQPPKKRSVRVFQLLDFMLNREYNASSFDRFAHATAYSLQMGVLIL